MREEVQRRAYYGTVLTWYGVDMTNSVTQFDSGDGAVPKKTMSSGAEYYYVEKYFESLPEITESVLSEKYQKLYEENQKKFTRPLNFYDFVHEVSRKGLYNFNGEADTNNYELVSMPQRELKVDELAEEIRGYLADFVFKDVIFKEVTKLDITKYLECVGVLDNERSSLMGCLWQLFDRRK